MSVVRRWWTFAIVSLALFMAMLDNLVVTTALPSIRTALHANISDLQWTIDAYTLAFAALMIPAAALGDRFGRRRVLPQRRFPPARPPLAGRAPCRVPVPPR